MKKKKIVKKTTSKRTGTKSKTHKSELEFLREEVRKLKSIIRNLKKENKRNNRSLSRLDDLEEILEDNSFEEAKKIHEEKCSVCYKGTYGIFDLGARKLKICSQCGHRKVFK